MTCGVPRPVTFDGVVYPTQSALARRLGLSRSTVHLAVKQGRVDGLGQGRAPGLKAAWSARRQPVAACGFEWPSQRDCARDLGVPDSVVSEALAHGRFDALVARRKGRAKGDGGRDAA